MSQHPRERRCHHPLARVANPEGPLFEVYCQDDGCAMDGLGCEIACGEILVAWRDREHPRDRRVYRMGEVPEIVYQPGGHRCA